MLFYSYRDALLDDDDGSNGAFSFGVSGNLKPTVVLDPRAVTNSAAPSATVGRHVRSPLPPSTAGLLSGGSGLARLQTVSGGSGGGNGLASPGGGYGAAPGPLSRQFSVPAGVPAAMNEALVLDEGLRAQVRLLLLEVPVVHCAGV
jgi:hypothetical protein